MTNTTTGGLVDAAIHDLEMETLRRVCDERTRSGLPEAGRALDRLKARLSEAEREKRETLNYIATMSEGSAPDELLAAVEYIVLCGADLEARLAGYEQALPDLVAAVQRLLLDGRLISDGDTRLWTPSRSAMDALIAAHDVARAALSEEVK